ncbi:vasotab-like [Thrips palmi]|uniref:Vasotab-like n=1 Tax=Thrips palmi TaxID=161013 RepID=A0A6P8YEM1_THRPL|nr:vasotab-like [Thrips palmi]
MAGRGGSPQSRSALQSTMRATVVIVLLSLLVAVFGNPAVRPCPDVCTADYAPVCAVLRGVYRTFSNECQLAMTICKKRQPWRVVAKCACVDEKGAPPGSYRPSVGK